MKRRDHWLPLTVMMMLSLVRCSCDDSTVVALTRLIVVDVRRVQFAPTYIGGQRVQQVQVTNAGTAPLSIASTLDSAVFSLSDAPATLRAGDSVTLSVAFTPQQVGLAEAVVAITSDATNVARAIVDVVGEGLLPLDCDDANSCTDERFDADVGACVRADREGACNDDNACSTDDRCSDGDCVGTALVCADDIACTLDSCDAQRGCVFIEDNDACADDDGCTLDRCSAQSGCANSPAPDGTLCGDFTVCQSIHLCVSQLCTQVDIPQGTPCSDADICTTDDVCDGGTCTGVGVIAPPAVVKETFRVGADPIEVAIANDTLYVADGTLKMMPFDALDSRSVFAPVVLPSALTAVGDALVALTETPASGNANAWRVLAFNVATPLAPVLASDTFLSAAPTDREVFFAPPFAYVCTFDGINVVDTTTATAAHGQVPYCRDWTVLNDARHSAMHASKLLQYASLQGQLTLYTLNGLTTDASPIEGATPDGPASPDGVFFDGDFGVVAASSSRRGVLCDLRDVEPRVAAFDWTTFPAGVQPVALSDGVVYFNDVIHRIDIHDIDAPAVLPAFDFPSGYRLDRAVVHEDHVAFFSSAGLVVAMTTASEVANITNQVGALDAIAAQSPSRLVVVSNSVAEVAAPPFDPAASPFARFPNRDLQIVRDDSGLAGLYQPSAFGSAVVFSALAPAVRADAVPAIDLSNFDATTTTTDTGAGLPVAADTIVVPDNTDGQLVALRSPQSCVAVALAHDPNVDCSDAPGVPCADLRVHTFSLCSAGASVVALAASELLAVDDAFLPNRTSSSVHASGASFFGEHSALLVDTTDLLAPTVIAADVPELDRRELHQRGLRRLPLGDGGARRRRQHDAVGV